MKRLLIILPVVILVPLLILMLWGLNRDPSALNLALENRPLPPLQMYLLNDDYASPDFPPAPLSQHIDRDRPTVINFFASWCVPCVAEHPELMALATEDDIRLLGILYKDTDANGQAFLQRLGDPYQVVFTDPRGRGAIDMGLYGVPETYVISADRTVIGRVDEPLTNPGAMDELKAYISAARERGDNN